MTTPSTPTTAAAATPSTEQTGSAAPEQSYPVGVPFPYQAGAPGYHPNAFFNYPPPPPPPTDAPDGANGPPGPGPQMIYPQVPGMYPVFGPPGHPSFSIPPAPQPSPKSKRKQVKMACTNCAAACKRCDEVRPCQRCRKYGFADSCQDGTRKERVKGLKRGPYKRKGKGYGDGSDGIHADPSQWVSQPSAPPESSAASGASPAPTGPPMQHPMYAFPHGVPTEQYPFPGPWIYQAGHPPPFALMSPEAMAASVTNGQPIPGHEMTGPHHMIMPGYIMGMPGMPGLPVPMGAPHPYAYSPAAGVFHPGMVPMPQPHLTEPPRPAPATQPPTGQEIPAVQTPESEEGKSAEPDAAPAAAQATSGETSVSAGEPSEELLPSSPAPSSP